MRETFAPIVLFVYNRPSHTRNTLEALLSNPEAANSSLYVFADGPKNEDERRSRDFEEVRTIIKSLNGFAEVIVEESDVNKGLASSIIHGVSKVMDIAGRAIVVEDDLQVSPFFLSYMNDGLNKYENDERIWAVSGYTDTRCLNPQLTPTAFLVDSFICWGWGTWKKRWEMAIWDFSFYKKISQYDHLLLDFGNKCGNSFPVMILLMLEGKINSWALRYGFSAFLYGKYTLLPNKSLVLNIGLDGSGTHSGVQYVELLMAEENILLPKLPCYDERISKILAGSFVSNNRFKNIITEWSIIKKLHWKWIKFKFKKNIL